LVEDFSYGFPIAKSRITHGFMLAGVLAAIGIWASLFADPQITGGPLLGLVNLGLAGGIAFHIWRLSRNKRPRLVIDQRGIWFRDWKLDPVPWSQIEGTLQKGGRLQAFLCLQLRDPEGLFSSLPAEQRGKAQANRLIRPPLLMIPAHSVDADFSEIRAAIDNGKMRADSASLA
jgi:hypothetical protein